MSKATAARLATLSLFWGSVFLWIKIAGYAFSAVQMVLVRLVLGAIVLLIIMRLRGMRLPTEKRIWGHLAVAALIGNAIPWVLYAEGERLGTSSAAAVVNGSAPVWTLAATLLLGAEARVNMAKVGGVLFGLSGTVLVAAPWHSGGHNSVLSIVCFVLGSISFGSSFAYMHRFLAGRGVPPLTLAGGQLSVASAMLLLVTPFLGLQPIHFRTDSVIALIILGVICTGFASVLNFELIFKDGASVASTVTYLMTVIAVILGALALSEHIGWNVAIGTVAVLGATALLRRKAPAKPAAAPPPAVATSGSSASGQK